MVWILLKIIWFGTKKEYEKWVQNPERIEMGAGPRKKIRCCMERVKKEKEIKIYKKNNKK